MITRNIKNKNKNKKKISHKMALRILLLSVAITIVACNRDQDATPVKAQTQPAAAPSLPTLSLPADGGSPPAFDSTRAMQYVREIVALGPR
ncbi:MAG: hypothetical protein WA594_20215, partial [Candidatus Sulfotelmatobacter sp.]